MPSLGESSSPRIESSVVLPQPDGPAIATYSPCRISRWMSGQRVGLDLVGVEDLLDSLERDERCRSLGCPSVVGLSADRLWLSATVRLVLLRVVTSVVE